MGDRVHLLAAIVVFGEIWAGSVPPANSHFLCIPLQYPPVMTSWVAIETEMGRTLCHLFWMSLTLGSCHLILQLHPWTVWNRLHPPMFSTRMAISMSFGSSCVVFGGLCAIVMARFPLTPPFFLIREKERTKIFRNTQGVAAPRKTINVDSMIQKRCVRSEYTAFCRVTLQLPIA